MIAARRNRLSALQREEDEQEEVERTHPGSTLTLPYSLRKGEATQGTPRHSKIWA